MDRPRGDIMNVMSIIINWGWTQTVSRIMQERATIELSPEVRYRLLEWGPDGYSEEAIVEELLDEIEYLERVTDVATGGRWPSSEYY